MKRYLTYELAQYLLALFSVKSLQKMQNLKCMKNSAVLILYHLEIIVIIELCMLLIVDFYCSRWRGKKMKTYYAKNSFLYFDGYPRAEMISETASISTAVTSTKQLSVQVVKD